MVFGRRRGPLISQPGPELVFEPLTRKDLLARAEAGNIDAMMELAKQSFDGIGVPQDRAAAAVWLRKAEAAGWDLATFMLAHMYMEGTGIPKDGHEAMRRFQSLSARNSGALVGLGIAHLRGDIVQQNVVLAYVCFRIAATLGDKEGVARLAPVAANISPAQLEQGDTLFAAWKPGMPAPTLTEGDVTMPADIQRMRATFFESFAAALRDLSRGDLSVLEAASRQPEALIMTVAHSRLAVFATLMERGGWALPQTVPEAISLDGRVRQYLIAEVGREALQQLFQALPQRPAR